MRSYVHRLAGTVLGLTLVLTQALGAQVLVGVLVDDDTDLVIEGATITLFSFQGQRFGSVVSDLEGRFVLDAPRLGDFRLLAERIGYQTTRSQRFMVSTLDTITVTFFLASEVVLLEPLVVTIPVIQGRKLFERRLELGKGVLLGPEAVDSLRPERHAGEILQHVDKVRVRWGWGYYENGRNGPMPRVRTYLGNGCVNYIVDRTPIPDPWFLGVSSPWGVSPLAELTPEDLVAVEIYRHVTEVPDDFMNQLIIDTRDKGRKVRDMFHRDFTCGVVIFWTEESW